jgi:two-component system nitrate/nitrite response regulator NarL
VAEACRDRHRRPRHRDKAGRTVVAKKGVPRSPPPPVRVIIVAEIRFYREGLAGFFGVGDGFEVVGTSEDVGSAVELGRRGPVDVVLVDMAIAGAPQVIRTLRAALPSAGVVALGVREAEQEVIPLAEAGITGLVPHEASLEELSDVVRSAARGETLCSARTAAMLVRRVAALTEQLPERGRVPLTSRQLEIVWLIAEGLGNKAIAQRLFIEVPTVKNHVHNILERLDVQRREDAASEVKRLSSGRLVRWGRPA